jgi:hypothetical protein
MGVAHEESQCVAAQQFAPGFGASSWQKSKGEKPMHQSETTQTTLGELIVAVTDEVRPLTGNGTNTGVIVSLILQDLFRRRRVRLQKRTRRGR